MKQLSLLLLATPLTAFGCGGFFYEAPPTLDRYPERLPVKTMRELLREAHPPAGKAATFDELTAEVQGLATGLTDAPPKETLAKIEQALEHNRTGDYRKRFANCLNDLHDLLIDGAAAEAKAGGYLQTRMAAMDQDDGFIYRPAKVESYDDAAKKAEAERRVALDAAAANLDQGVQKASASLRPHWQVMLGAQRFRAAEFGEAARIFAGIIAENPKHPRAEIASLMLARSRLEEWRDAVKDKSTPRETTDKLYKDADAAFTAYLAYPAVIT